jgi:hypothetical protein
MAVADVVDMHEVQPGVDERRNAAPRPLDNDATIPTLRGRSNALKAAVHAAAAFLR